MSWHRCPLGTRALATWLVSALMIDLLACASALAACTSRETERQLGLAEEHRTWVELWSDLDNREALAELGFFSARLERAVQASAVLDCEDRTWMGLIQSRINHEWAWHDRTYRLLTGTAFAGAAMQTRAWRVRTSQQLGPSR